MSKGRCHYPTVDTLFLRDEYCATKCPTGIAKDTPECIRKRAVGECPYRNMMVEVLR